MTEVERVICPVDFSDFSRRALDHAIAVARWYGSGLTVLYVHQVPLQALGPVSGLGAAPLEPLALVPEDREKLRKELEAFVPQVPPNLAVECRVAEGNVATEILAEASPDDMIVMGTHGRSGFEHLVLGSVTEKVLRKACCPVLTIPRAAPDAEPVPKLFHHIVAAVDFSSASMQALELAASLAEEADAHLTVLHVIDLPPDPMLWMDRNDGASYVREFEEGATLRLRESVPDSVRESSHVEEIVTTGQPYREILHIAAQRRAGLIVIGAHGRDIVERMFLGSTAQHVVRQAECPVLTIRQV